ncbi:hypothetical protein CRN47_13715 [Vibrio vulnificus]|nr:hypothetical protein CRN47_13715 [Vibrio vulnificus]
MFNCETIRFRNNGDILSNAINNQVQKVSSGIFPRTEKTKLKEIIKYANAISRLVDNRFIYILGRDDYGKSNEFEFIKLSNQHCEYSSPGLYEKGDIYRFLVYSNGRIYPIFNIIFFEDNYLEWVDVFIFNERIENIECDNYVNRLRNRDFIKQYKSNEIVKHNLIVERINAIRYMNECDVHPSSKGIGYILKKEVRELAKILTLFGDNSYLDYLPTNLSDFYKTSLEMIMKIHETKIPYRNYATDGFDEIFYRALNEQKIEIYLDSHQESQNETLKPHMYKKKWDGFYDWFNKSKFRKTYR